MNKHTKLRNTLILQVLISAVALGFISYKTHDFIEANRDLTGTYYTITTMTSIVIGVIVEYFMNKLYEILKVKAEKKVLNSNPTEEYQPLKDSIEKENRNRYAKQYRDNYE